MVEMPAGHGQHERRGSPRRRLLKNIQVLGLDKKLIPSRHVVLRNLAHSGAMLSGPGAAISRFPNQFFLVARGQLRMVRCKIVWRTYDEVGLRFLSDPGPLLAGLLPETGRRKNWDHEPVSDVTRREENELAGTGEVKINSEPADAVRPAPFGVACNQPLQVWADDLQSETVTGTDPSGVAPQPGEICYLPIDLLAPNPNHPRRAFDPDQLAELAQSIRDRGFLQPLIVRATVSGGYEVVAGERRRRAALLAQLRTVPVIIGEFSDGETLEAAMIENLQRSDLNPLEEAHAYVKLIEHFGYTQRQLAATVGKSRSHISNTMRLLMLPDEVKAHLERGTLTAGHARALLPAEAPTELANEIVERGLSVRDTERLTVSQKASGPGNGSDSADIDSKFREVELKTSELLGLSVRITEPGRSGGRVVVHFRTLEELAMICRRLSVEPDVQP